MNDLVLDSIYIDDKKLSDSDYQLTEEKLIINNAPDNFTTTITTIINPEKNTRLEGLYISGGHFCTQCEAEGFRRITYFQDRPDVMCTITTTITAPKEYPILLSNGNRIDYTDNGNTHTAVWDDPFKKPCYLFALVGGDLVGIQDTFTTKSGRKVDLKIYTDYGNENRLGYAMDSLIRSMAWDEKVWNREYELGRISYCRGK